MDNDMYCIKCGVALAESEEKCPLCGTRVYHPDLEIPHGDPLFPDNLGRKGPVCSADFHQLCNHLAPLRHAEQTVYIQ